MPALELVGMLNRVPCFVPHDARELVASATFHIEHLTSLEPDEPGVRQVDWNRKAGDALRREPLFRKPDMGAKLEAAARQRFVQRVDPRLEPCPFYSKTEVLDAKLKQSLVRPGCPGESSFRHTANMCGVGSLGESRERCSMSTGGVTRRVQAGPFASSSTV